MSLSEYITNFDHTIRKQISPARQKIPDNVHTDIPRVLGVLAKGGMATIYEAEQLIPSRKVVVKKIENEHDLELQHSLYQEAMIMGSLDHPNIIPIHQIIMENNTPSVVMKLVRGQTLKQKIQQGCTILEAMRIILQVCHAVEYAHRQEIIHRDIKPSNIMIGDFNEIYLLDWGIAIDKNQLHLAMEGLVGSPSFMAPEMLSGKPETITEQTDIYLLGTTLHYALTGQRRHEANSFSELFQMIEEAPSYEYDPSIPKELGSLLNSTCHKDPQSRPQNVKEFHTSLLSICNHWEVIQLSMEGEQRAQQCYSEQDNIQKEKRFTKARQDFEYALRIWPDSETAKEGLQDLLRHMLDWYIQNKNPREAHKTYLLLNEENPELLSKITELLEGNTFLNKEQVRLLQIGQANDFVQTKETSAAFSKFIGIGAIMTTVTGNMTQFFYQFPLTHELLWASALFILVLISFLMYSRRAVWMHNRSMERMCISALGTLIFMSLNRFLAMKSNLDINSVLTTDCFAIGLGTLMVAQIVSYGYFMPCLCIALGLVSTFFPSLALPCLSLISLIVPFGTWWAWKRR